MQVRKQCMDMIKFEIQNNDIFWINWQLQYLSKVFLSLSLSLSVSLHPSIGRVFILWPSLHSYKILKKKKINSKSQLSSVRRMMMMMMMIVCINSILRSIHVKISKMRKKRIQKTIKKYGIDFGQFNSP